uniref:Uncharacterized protein n=2 Tax=Tetradesmus obliquus TaxID=3088 RepID=A0A383V2A8_TETOB|eukprot:jgi/Sobl393_1/19727/SZX59707.1
MALSGEADGAHAAATAAVVPLLRLAEPAVAAAIKQGLKLLYAAAREGASVPADVLQTVTSSLRALVVPACGTTAVIPTAAAAAAAPSTARKRSYGSAMAAAAAAPSTARKRSYGSAMVAAAAATEEGSSKKQKVQKPPPASSDGRPGIWLDDNEYWVQLGDHVFMEVECRAKNVRDKASFKVAAVAVAAQDAGGASGSSGSNSSNSDMQHLVWMFRVERVEDSCVHGRAAGLSRAPADHSKAYTLLRRCIYSEVLPLEAALLPRFLFVSSPSFPASFCFTSLRCFTISTVRASLQSLTRDTADTHAGRKMCSNDCAALQLLFPSSWLLLQHICFCCCCSGSKLAASAQLLAAAAAPAVMWQQQRQHGHRH